MRLVLPHPPSVNNLYATFNGRRILSREGRAYHEAVLDACAAQAKNDPGFGDTDRLRYELDISPPDKRRRDLSNVIKAIEDALTKAGIWGDDSQVDHITVSRREPVKGGRAEIRIAAIGMAPNTPHAFPRSEA